MIAQLSSKVDIAATVKPALFYLQRPIRLIRTYDKINLRADVIAADCARCRQCLENPGY